MHECKKNGGGYDEGGSTRQLRGYKIQNVMVKLYNTGAEGAAIDRHAEYNAEEESVKVTNSPGDWMTAFQANGKIGRKATHAWAYEHLLRLGGNLPLWTGVITKQTNGFPANVGLHQERTT